MTAAINSVARGPPWRPGDEIIVAGTQHQAHLPWLATQQTYGTRVVLAPMEPGGLLRPQTLAALAGCEGSG